MSTQEQNTPRRIKDFVRDGHAWFRCESCGAETAIMKYSFDPSYGFHRFDMDLTKENLEAFFIKHALCKPVDKQVEIFESKHP